MEMVLGYLMVLIGIGGSAVAGYIDLKTTEIPDEIPLAMVLLGLLIRFSYSLFTGDWLFLFYPAVIGVGFFIFGMAMYYTGQWGGGDAKILGALGVLVGTLPAGIAAQSAFPLPVNLLLNVFLVGAVYITVYALAISLINRKIMDSFFSNIRGNVNELIIFIFAIAVILAANLFIFWRAFGIVNLWLMAGVAAGGTGFYLLWKFLRTVEKVGFTKRIRTRDLREGDMIGEDIPRLKLYKKIIKGLTKEEVKKVRKLKKNVWIREGVRFGPVFPISVAVTLFLGNLLMMIF